MKAGRQDCRRRRYAAQGRLAEGICANPQVTVDVEQFRSQSVFVMGEVRTPGKYMLSGSSRCSTRWRRRVRPTPAAGAEVLILHPKTAVDWRADAARQRDADVSV